MKDQKIKKAKKETSEAYEATYDAARCATNGKTKSNLVRAVVDLEKAEAEIEEAEDEEESC